VLNLNRITFIRNILYRYARMIWFVKIYYITSCRYMWCSPKQIGGAYSRRLVRPSVSLSVRTSHSCPAHNIVIWSRISKLCYRNVETTCRVQHLGPYLEGQGHSMTLQQNRVRPITLLFEVGFQKYFTKMITILRRRVARNIWVAILKFKVTAWHCSKIVSGP